MGMPAAAEAPADTTLAEQYFQEARALWKSDGGRLWGVSLEGPLLFAHPGTRRILASQADREGKLHPEGAIFVGQLPEGEPIANNTLRWAGVQWITVVWPLPENRAERAVLLMHESWHRIQQGLGLPATNPANRHLDTPEGRLWLQLEWRALREALGRHGDQRRKAVEDALAFRSYRRGLTERATAEERALEMHEGLAEYTGVKLSGLSAEEQVRYVREKLDKRPRTMPTFVRSFAYLSGPAYGLLLDEVGASWRKSVKPQQDLGVLLQEALGLDAPRPSEADCRQRAKQYSGEELQAAEAERERARQKRAAEFRARLVDGPVLILPLQKLQFTFDPTNVEPLGDSGTVYPNARISDEWGVLTVSAGALISPNFTKVTVVAPKDPEARPLKGDGWEMQLRPGWVVELGPRTGDHRLRQRKP
jgi:hypothetical protein